MIAWFGMIVGIVLWFGGGVTIVRAESNKLAALGFPMMILAGAIIGASMASLVGHEPEYWWGPWFVGAIFGSVPAGPPTMVRYIKIQRAKHDPHGRQARGYGRQGEVFV